jgi:hypothetical protein
MSTIDTCADARVLRPIPSVARAFALSGVALITPLFAVLYFLSVPEGTWRAVLAEHVLVTLACAVAAFALGRSRVWITARGIVMRGPLGLRRSLDREQIRQLILVQTYRGQTLDTQPQLFVVTEDGGAAMRLRGWMWSRDSMRHLSQELDVPLTTVHEAMTHSELRRLHPHLLSWLERRRGARVTAIAAGVALGVCVAVALLAALGLPGSVDL